MYKHTIHLIFYRQDILHVITAPVFFIECYCFRLLIPPITLGIGEATITAYPKIYIDHIKFYKVCKIQSI